LSLLSCDAVVDNPQSVREFSHQDMLVPWHHSDRARTQQQSLTTTTTTAAIATATTTSSSASSKSTDSSGGRATAATDVTVTEQTGTGLLQEVW
jgi:hypothetical protein